MKAISENIHARGYQIRILIGALFAAIVADGIITMYLIRTGLAREGNPFMEYWVAQNQLIFYKVCGGILVAICLWSIYRRKPMVSIAFTSILLAVYVAIITWNLLILF